MQALRDTADFKVKNNQACLEACLRTLIMTMQQVRSFCCIDRNVLNFIKIFLFLCS